MLKVFGWLIIRFSHNWFYGRAFDNKHLWLKALDSAIGNCFRIHSINRKGHSSFELIKDQIKRRQVLQIQSHFSTIRLECLEVDFRKLHESFEQYIYQFLICFFFSRKWCSHWQWCWRCSQPQRRHNTVTTVTTHMHIITVLMVMVDTTTIIRTIIMAPTPTPTSTVIPTRITRTCTIYIMRIETLAIPPTTPMA